MLDVQKQEQQRVIIDKMNQEKERRLKLSGMFKDGPQEEMIFSFQRKKYEEDLMKTAKQLAKRKKLMSEGRRSGDQENTLEDANKLHEDRKMK